MNCSRLVRKLYVCLLVVLFLNGGFAAFGQIPSVSDTTSTPIPNVGHDYIQAPAETVNPANGSLSIRIGVPIPPSRGLSIPFNFAYDSNGAFYLGTACQGCGGFHWLTTPTMLSQGGWSYSVPMLSVQSSSFNMQDVSPTDTVSNFVCQARTDFVMQDPHGDRHNLGVSYFNSNPICSEAEGGPDTIVTSAQVGQLLTTTTATWSGEASNATGAINPLKVTDGDGTVYSFGGGLAPQLCNICSIPDLKTYPPGAVTDRNGNKVTIGYSTTQGSPNLTYTDTIGRTALSVPTFGATQDSVTVLGLANPYKVVWQAASANFPITLTNIPIQNNGTCSGPGTQPSISVVSSITLPNLQQYTFTYDPIYGLISKITYPTGGYVRYVWGLNHNSETGDWPIYTAEEVVGPGGIPTGQSYLQQTGTCLYYYDTPAIVHRYVSFDGVNEVEQQDFTYSTTWSQIGAEDTWTQKKTIVLTHDLLRGTEFSTIYTYGPNYADEQPNTNGLPAQIPVETSIETFDMTGAQLSTVTELWSNAGRELTLRNTSLPLSPSGSQVTETDWAYNTNEMVTEKDDYSYGAGARGALYRKTLFPSYHSFTAHIVDKPDSVTVQDGSGNFAAGVGYTYDSVGNILNRSDWLNSNGSSALTTSHTYDPYGNIITTTDPKSNVTTYSYKDAFADSCSYTSPSNAYLTGITYPATNGASHTESFTYYCATGSLASSTDQNKQTTSYSYADPLNRITQILGPPDPNNSNQQATTTYSYSDVGPTPSVTTSQLLNTAGTLKTSVVTSDGIGHAIQTSVTTDPSGPDMVTTTYDGLGRVYKATNPYRSTDTTSLTTYTYDALGRTTNQLHPDSSSASWSYNGSTTTFKDENAHSWTQTTDALGRLISVAEPTNATTKYGFDVLGNLTSATQTGLSGEAPRTRTFTYDSLSRLLTAHNPETGTVCYGQWNGSNCINGYDSNSNLIAKTDARGIITNYSYDALNRMLSKNYTNDPGGTASSCYQYDLSSVPNAVGRMTAQWTQSASAGVCSLSNTPWTKRAIVQYDSMGRVLSEQQYTPATVASGTPYTPAYTYDLAGNLITSTDGVTPTPTTPGSTLTFTNCIDGANHLQTLSSNWIDSTHPQSLFSAQGTRSTPCANTSSPSVTSLGYAAFGGLTNAILGKGLTITRGYDNRLRITAETATGGATSAATKGSTTITVSGAEQSQ